MKINIFGMGYVGCLTAACLAKDKHDIVGIDTDQLKVSMINDGKSPIVEPGLQEVISEAVSSHNLSTMINNLSNLRPAEISFVCVGTPSNENGGLNLDHVIKIAEQIGEYLRELQSYHVVNIRSTVLPGTVEDTIIPTIERKSGKKAGLDFGVCMNPEFMREGTSIHDHYNPPFTIIGEIDRKSGDVISKIYKDINAPLIRTSIKVAEMVKYTCNVFHALKVTFANEIGNICKRLNIDSHEVMDIFCRDEKLNISPYYLKPGFAFGGSCLPKDLRAILYKTQELHLESPVLSTILNSNKNQIEHAYKLVEKTGRKKVGILGLSFKPNTDDLRESPMVELVEKLIGKGYFVSIYDGEVSMARIYGSNKRYIEGVIPHVSSLMKQSIQEVIDNSQVIVVCNKSKEFEEVIPGIEDDKIIVDLVRIVSNVAERNGNYEGICW
jgi:GDP-mannose 6-dehydrogenase